MYRTVVIGASGEIGGAMVSSALARCDRVAAYDIEVPEHTGCDRCGSIDIRNQKSVQAALKEAAEHLGGIDILLNCAGIMTRGSLKNTGDKIFSHVLDVNLTGAFRLTQAVANLMSSDHGGSIVHVSSIHALRGSSDRIAYAASKGGLSAMIHAAAAELGPRGITINAVAPGPTGRGMGSASNDRTRALARIPLRRAAIPEEVAAAAMFLTSTAGRYITGHILPIDGGASSTFFAAPNSADTTEDMPIDQ